VVDWFNERALLVVRSATFSFRMRRLMKWSEAICAEEIATASCFGAVRWVGGELLLRKVVVKLVPILSSASTP